MLNKHFEPGQIGQILLEHEMQSSYLSYALSVVKGRAIPDARDGLKPVHRRILWGLRGLGCLSNRPHRKSARITGDVMGKYHPHGNAAIYDAMIRMSQNFAMRLMLVDCQGNNGSIDGDPPAAERYTEVRLAQPGEMLLQDIDEGVVDMNPNYDNSCVEPTVLPVSFPVLLVNGSSGIAVGLSASIPPHNPQEIISAAILMLEKPDVSLDELLSIVQGPDFPTGGMISPGKALYEAYKTGKGSVFLRGHCVIKDDRITITSIPYQVNKSKLVEHIAELMQSKTIEGVDEIRDESDRTGMRVILELKKHACAETIVHKLYKLTNLQVNVSIQISAIYNERPKQLGLLEALQIFLDFREEVVVRRTRYRLIKARERMHTLAGLALALDAIDQVIAIIRSSKDSAEARERLCAMEWSAEQLATISKISGEYFGRLSALQAQSILDLKLQRLTRLERDQVLGEIAELFSHSQNLGQILSDRKIRVKLIKSELITTSKLLAAPRKTELVDFEPHPGTEALISREAMIVTVSVSGYIKRTPLATYQTQNRGGKGRASIKNEEVLAQVFAADTLQEILFFSNSGRVYSKKVYELPLASTTARGKSLLSLIPEDAISAILPIPQNAQGTLVFATSTGYVRRNALSDFTNLRYDGKIAMKLSGDERLVGVRLADPNNLIILATRNAKLIKFSVSELRVMSSRQSTGVSGIILDKNDRVIALHAIENDTELLSVSDNGYGKKTVASMYRGSRRGGKGVFAMEISSKTGELADVIPVLSGQDVILMTNQGQTIRLKSSDIRSTGRCAQGVRLLSTDGLVAQVIGVEAQEIEGPMSN
jgi:DNA gyrase subunit A